VVGQIPFKAPEERDAEARRARREARLALLAHLVQGILWRLGLRERE
jgi:hypothetical protein